ncbi:hypothetical protein NKH61_34970 [Mesorhizobium sp. M1005]
MSADLIMCQCIKDFIRACKQSEMATSGSCRAFVATILRLLHRRRTQLLRQHFLLPAFLLMSSPDALHLRFAAAGQLCRPADTVAARPEDNNAFVCHQSAWSGIFPARLCQFDALPLAFAAILEVVPSHLQGELQQHFLNGLEHDLGNAVGVCLCLKLKS